MTLGELGWDAGWAAAFEAHEDWVERGWVPARVVAQSGALRVATGGAEVVAAVAGRLQRSGRTGQAGQAGRSVRLREAAACEAAVTLPAVGDWVVVAMATPATPAKNGPGARDVTAEAGRAVIHGVLPRRTRFSRKAAGTRAVEQVVAANVDVVLLVVGLDGDFNPRRLERYLAAGWESGALPVVVLNKADACDPEERAAAEAAIAAVAPGVAVLMLSARSGEGVEGLAPYLGEGKTVALLGSSGAGKSTLVNRLLGDGSARRQRTAAVREGDSRGRHTTTHREIFAMPGGALLLDTPGMRELQPWDAEAGLEAAFGDLERLAAGCRFGDCSHTMEPGCAVLAAVAAGEVDAARLASFHKLGRELNHLQARLDPRVAHDARAELKALMRSINRQKRGSGD